VQEILIVENDHAVFEVAQKVLRRAGFSLAKAASLSEAIHSRKQAELAVLNLEFLRGQEKRVLRELAPFIIIAKRVDEEKAVQMVKRGALEYVIHDAGLSKSLPVAARRSLELVRTGKRLARAEAALAKSKAKMLAVSEREQKRFGAELHDSLGQQLTTIELRCQSLKQDLPRNKPDLHAQLAQICEFLRDAVTQTRAMARALAPLELHSQNLVEALQELAARLSKTSRTRCYLRVRSNILLPNSTVAGHLFRIAQEAVNNAVKHSRARTVNVALARDNGQLSLMVSDNGVGFPAKGAKNGGIGLQLMQHRASAMGGKLDIQSKPGRGVTVSCIVPMES
jgi:signal transduction histidine kinase